MEPTTRTPDPGRSRTTRVLVVDPNEEHQIEAVAAIAQRGIEVKATSSAREGLRLLQGAPFDAIVVDSKLRDVPALELLKDLARAFPQTPRIFLVPQGGDEIALRGLDAGATAFVMKSPSFRILIPAVVDRQVREVRARRGMEDALGESQRVLSTLMSNLPGMAYRRRNDPPRWTYEFASDGSQALTGYSPDEFRRGTVGFSQLIHPDDRDRVARAVAAAIETKRPYQILFRMRTASGAEKWVWEQGRGVYGPDGAVRSLEGFISDVTEKEATREQLERSERLYRALFEEASDGILRLDEAGRVTAINPAAVEFLGRPASEIVGHAVADFLLPEDAPRARRFLEGVLAGEPARETFETTIVSRTKGRRTIEIAGRRLQGGPGPAAVEVIARDITERRELLKKIADSERLASLGRIALYVAHEINTPLTSISLLTAAVEHRLTDPEAREKLGKIHAQRRRAAAIVSGLLNFSRPQRVEGKDTDLHELVQAAVEHVESHRRPGVSLFADMDPHPVVARVDPPLMESVFVSLLRNALEATTAGSVVVRLTEQPDHVVVRVSDTGTGMSKQVLERLFEPFFTTKKFGHATGLGLAWSKKIVEGHGGTLEVSSKPGEGSVFTILLPRRPEGTALAEAGSSVAMGPSEDSEKPRQGASAA
ncbi:MAG TPA: PAS domain S-box protein [Thermoplasmata archaeon]|nr:PAS domain S-box protein [Thermoplasmata archaeon]